MNWTYEVASGKLYDPEGEHVATGYSGNGAAKNNVMMERTHGQGPIPRGTYQIGAVIIPKTHTGPVAMRLTPGENTQVFGRSAFEIHGDSLSNPGSASHGCIILMRPVREMIASSPVKILKVI